MSATTYEEATNLLIDLAKRDRRAVITALAVHGLTLAAEDHSFGIKINDFDLVVPDGQPIRWALNLLHKTRLADRVYGPELMLRLCRKATDHGVGIYLYGSYPQVVSDLSASLLHLFPALRICGKEPSVFRPLSPEEDKALIERINGSGANFLFVGLGCPLQEIFAYEHKLSINGIQVCVGAAFDFHAGNKPMAPPWMQRNGLEWLFRLSREPGRLWQRYLFTNTIFLMKFARQYFAHTASR